MVKEAESHASEDRARRELIDARNQADSLAYQVEKTVHDNRERVAAAERVADRGGDCRGAHRGPGRRPGRDHTGGRRAAARVARTRRADVQGRAEPRRVRTARTVRTSRTEKWSTRSTRRRRSRPTGQVGRLGMANDLRHLAAPAPIVRRRAMTIVRWDPFRDFGFAQASTWMPPVDIHQTGDHELVLKAELPDMSREDIGITIENFVLTLTGEKKIVERRQAGALPPRRAALRHVQPIVLAPADRGRRQGLGRVQERRVDRTAAAARGSQAPADQGRSRRVRPTSGGAVAGEKSPPLAPSHRSCYALWIAYG